MSVFTVTMHGESGDLDVYENPVMDRRPGEPHTIETWDDAIRAAWNRLSPRGGGWESATIVGPHGHTVRLLEADRRRADDDAMRRVREDADRLEAHLLAAGSAPEALFGDDGPGPEGD